MKWLLLVAGFLTMTDVCAQSARFGSRMVSIGDPVTRVRDVAGSPEKIEQADASEGAEVWVYKRKGRKIQLWMANGKVVQVEDKKDSGDA
ncbi:hypothetical protein [Tahibacter amnicola]|uniref:DUF2845 domain-containing protein n=1 Tax=Tahibacter amnicola TaxID=2976241 RepID=A0ABY6BL10_9GAMM|nr:hypothetical protein [Tahibacter amnicola]UXI69070.1 hypothetical protein N4264_05305 [Tahibacter amnicola]